MILRRTTDRSAIRGILENEQVRPFIFDGTGDIPVPVSEEIFHLLAREDAVIGIVSFVPLAPGAWNPHIAVLPEYRGNGTEIMRRGVAWMFENTDCRKMVAFPPVHNMAMVRVFEKCGFEREGMSTKSYFWRGEMRDRLMMGLNKENG